MPSRVLTTAPARPETALQHFESRLAFETDCWDVHQAMKEGPIDFVLVDTRSADAFEKAHIPNAVNIYHKDITPERLATFPKDTVFVVYCAGPHCNAADKAAIKFSQLGYRVKIMIGGITGWLDEEFELEPGPHVAFA